MMNVDNIKELTDKLVDVIGLWADDRISVLAESNPKMSVASVYLKRGVKNYLSREKERIEKSIENVSLFICEENGKVDFNTLFDDLLGVLREMEEISFSIGFTHGTIGKGVVKIQIPDNMFTNLLFGNLSSIKVTESDLSELRSLIVSENE